MRGKNLGTHPVKNRNRTLKYAIVPPDRIFNWLGMGNVTAWVNFPQLRKTWWSEGTVEIRQLIQNLYIKFFDKHTKHFTNLEASMLKDGFHAPVNTITGPPRGMYLDEAFPNHALPPELQDKPNTALCTHTFGGSRVIFAQKHNIEVPCFIYDFTNAFPNAEVLKTQQDVKRKFPKSYSIGGINSPVVVRAIVHTHQKNRKNDGNERNIRQQVVTEIKQELKRRGVV